MDVARAEGWSTGVVSDDSVTGATPAAFLVEHGNRNEHALIASKMIAQVGRRADIVLGGGRQWFRDEVADPAVLYDSGEQEVAARNGMALDASGVQVFSDWKTLRERMDGGELSGPVLGLFAPNVFSYFADGRRELRLVDLAATAIDFLKSKRRPFLLVVEAALPDKASHANNAKRAIVEVLELDATLAHLREAGGPNVLILVTTDHATGGLALNGYLKSRAKGDLLLRTNPASGSSVLTFASGPGGKPDVNVRDGVPLDAADVDFAQPALVAKESAFHTGGDVWLLGSGPGSERVKGYLDNTDIFRLARAAIRGDVFEGGGAKD